MDRTRGRRLGRLRVSSGNQGRPDAAIFSGRRMSDHGSQPAPEPDGADLSPRLKAVEPEVWPPLAEHPDECWVCVRIARRYARLGRTVSSALAVAGAGGVTLTFLVASPSLRADQWLAILLSLQFLRTAMWTCVWMADADFGSVS